MTYLKPLKKVVLSVCLLAAGVFAVAQTSPTSSPNTAQPVATPILTTPMSDLSGVFLSPSLQTGISGGLSATDLRTGRGSLNRGETLKEIPQSQARSISNPGAVATPVPVSGPPVRMAGRNGFSAGGVIARLERRLKEKSAPNASGSEKRARRFLNETAAKLLRGLLGIENEISLGGLEVGGVRKGAGGSGRQLSGQPQRQSAGTQKPQRGEGSLRTQERQHQAGGLAPPAPALTGQGQRREGEPRQGWGSGIEKRGGTERFGTLGNQALARVFKEDPQFSSALLDRIESAPYGSLLLREGGHGRSKWISSGRLKEEVLAEKLSRYLRHYFRAKAEERGYDSSREFLTFLKSGSPEAASARGELRQMLKNELDHRAEAWSSLFKNQPWTYLFRDRDYWEKPLRKYLRKLVSERAAASDRRVNIHSVGSAYGAETYSLAIVVHQVLREMGEDPSSWNVSIKAYDVSLLSLLSSESGAYRPTSRDLHSFKYNDIASYFRRIRNIDVGGLTGEGIYQLNRPLRDWISPVYVDLNDMGQHSAVREKADIVFANYLLFHLRLKPAAALAEYWLSGDWSNHGFLSMGQTIVAEVFSQPKEKKTGEKLGSERPFLERFRLSVGVVGAAFFGDTFRIYGNCLRNLWNKRLPGVRRALDLGRSFEENLRADPFFSAKLDSDILDSLLSFVRGRRVQVYLTTQPMAIHVDRKTREITLNVGWFLNDGTGSLRKETLLGLVRKGIESMESVARLVPVTREKSWVHPEWGRRVLDGNKRLLAQASRIKGGSFAVKPEIFGAAYSRENVPKAGLRKILSTAGSSAVVFEGNLNGKEVAIKTYGEPIQMEKNLMGEKKAWEDMVSYFENEIEMAKAMEEALGPEGLAPKVYGEVDVGGNPSWAMEKIKGKDPTFLTPREVKAFITDRTVNQAMRGFDVLNRKGLGGTDSPQGMILTEDQVINGVFRRKGGVVFMDLGGLTTNRGIWQTPQELVRELLFAKMAGERFIKTAPDVPIWQLVRRMPRAEKLALIERVGTVAQSLPTPRETVLYGRTLEGATLKVGRFPEGDILFWLAPGKLVPITDKYADEAPLQRARTVTVRI